MSPKKHLILLLQASIVWLMFWVIGLPDYYQQYSPVLLGVLCTLLSVVFSLFAIFMLARCREETRMSRAFWLSFYYTVPLAIYDTLYCGWYLGLGVGYLTSHWYLTVFYFSLWLTFIPTAWLLKSAAPQKV
jgi:small basic protein